MTGARRVLPILLVLAGATLTFVRAEQAAAPPVVVFETARGAIEFQLYPADAPKSVGHLVALVRRNFYRGLRFHRVTGSLAQIGDPLTRDMSRRDYWGNGGSGTPIGVAEFSKRRTHQRGAVGLAHAGVAQYADSQIYFMKTASPGLDGKHVIVGQVTSGLGVLDKIEVTDVVRRAYLKGEGPPSAPGR